MPQDEKWLENSVVLHRITEQKGRFWVEIVFVDRADPTHLLTRPIDHYPTYAKARIYADLFQRQIRRDPRGTFKLDDDTDDLCTN